MKRGAIITHATLSRALQAREKDARQRRSKFYVTLGNPYEYGRDRDIVVWAEDVQEAKTLGKGKLRLGEVVITAKLAINVEVHDGYCNCSGCEDLRDSRRVARKRSTET